MDHLRLPPSSNGRPVKIQMICDHIYDGKTFASYPEQRGYQKEKFFEGDFGKDGLNEFHKFLQEWLFFGLLIEIARVAGIFLEPITFHRPGIGGERFLSTESIPRLIRDWTCRAQTSGLESFQQWLNHVDSILAEACPYVRQLLSPDGEQFSNCSMPPDIAHCIVNLGWSLNHARNLWAHVLFRTSIQPSPSSDNFKPLYFRCTKRDEPVFDLGSWGYSQSTIRQLQKHNWCPSEFSMLLTHVHDANVLYFCGALPRRRSSESHNHCDSVKCLANQVKEADYKIRHIATCAGNCETWILPEDILCMTLERGAIPLIRVTKSETGEPVVSIHPATDQTPYVAISHVWGHGRGNPWNNALPECQLLKIGEYCKALEPAGIDKSFWIDTLCVPHQDEARKSAIAAMKMTYELAQNVLVLDIELEQLEHVSFHETVIHVFFSDWQRRLWTLQEGDYAKRLFFQLANGALDLRELWMTEVAKIMVGNQVFLFEDIDGAWLATFLLLEILFGAPAAGGFARLKNIPSILGYRSTSKPADEPICLASLFGIKVQELLPLSLDGRMAKLFETIKKLPLDYIFLDGTKLAQPGYRWAPKTFLGIESKSEPIRDENGTMLRGSKDENGNQLPLGRAEAMLEDDGIHIQCPGILFSLEHPSSTVDTFYIISGDFYGKGSSPLPQARSADHIIYNLVLDTLSAPNFDRNAFKGRLGVIFKNLPRICSNRSTDAILVFESSRHENLIYGVYACPAKATWFHAYEHPQFQNALSSPVSQKDLTIITAEELGCNQRWCVS